VELGVEVLSLNKAGVVDEFHDCAAQLLTFAYVVTGERVDFSVPSWFGQPSFRKYQRRIARWKLEIYDPLGISFSLADLSEGGNPDDPVKVRKALEKACARTGIPWRYESYE
jgi:hypothetical protein